MIKTFNKRALDSEFLGDLLDGPLTQILERVKKDDTLCLELRGSFIDIYYRGETLYFIQALGNHQYRISYNENYNKEKEIDTKSATLIEIPTVEKAVEDVSIHKQTMDYYFANHQKLEREFQQLILRENNNSGKVTDSTDYYILDIEYAFNGNNESGDEISARYDMLAVRWASEGSVRKKTQNLPISFIEVKYGDGAMGSGADVSTSGIHKHINDYINFRKDSSMLSALAEDMAEVFNQKHKLGLISSYQNREEELTISLNSNDVEFLFVLANHDPAKGKLLEEIDEAIKEWNGKPEEMYLDEIRVAVSSLIGYGLYAYDKNGENRYLTIREFYDSCNPTNRTAM